MKRILIASTVACFLVPIVSSAGLTYQFQSATTQPSSQTMTGMVKAEGPNMRVDMTKGDSALFKDGSIIVSSDGGKTLAVLDPSTKTFYQIDLSDLLGGANSVLKQFGGVISFNVKNPKVTVRDGGDAGKIEGYPVRQSSVESSYDVLLDALGQKMTLGMQMSTDVLWTDAIDAGFTNFLQMRGLRTGVEAVDKMLAAQTAAIKGFPLKQTTTTRVMMNGSSMTSTTTTTVSAIKQATFAAALFAMPSGYTRTENPIEKMMQKLGGQ